MARVVYHITFNCNGIAAIVECTTADSEQVIDGGFAYRELGCCGVTDGQVRKADVCCAIVAADGLHCCAIKGCYLAGAICYKTARIVAEQVTCNVDIVAVGVESRIFIDIQRAIYIHMICNQFQNLGHIFSSNQNTAQLRRCVQVESLTG